MSNRPPPLPPEAYARVFVNHPEGVQILDELIARFGGNPYVRGGLEQQRQTDFNAGKLEVVNFLLRRINRASEPNGPDEPDPE